MKVIIRTIPHEQQRYPTVGDWINAHGQLRYVIVSEMGNEDYAFLVAVHEMIEAWLCNKRGITQEAVDQFDRAFEAARLPGNIDEPGHAPDAPYRREHETAERVERLLAVELGIDWTEYERTVESL